MSGMDEPEEAPPVVAVVVTHDPGPWLEETLAALGAQDYPAFSILVIDSASEQQVAPRVAAALPGAYVRRLDTNGGFAAAADDVLSVVQGASHLLFCHDDVAPERGAVRQMMENAFRENAGIVTPKLVEWDHPDRLLALGSSVDRVGTPVDLVDPGELDQGQRDHVREVFVAPDACFLIRADLFSSLGGFDPEVGPDGAARDLSWRARVAGARTVTAPAARVRHRGPMDDSPRPGPKGSPIALEHRDRLRTLLVTTPTRRLPLVVTVAAARTMTEAVLGVVLRRPGRARAALGAWTWNLRHLGSIREARKRLQPMRNVPDTQVRSVMRNSGSLSALFNDLAAEEPGGRTLGGVGRDVVDWWRSGGLRRTSTVVAAVVVVFLVGSRHLLGAPMPALGSLAPLPGTGTLFRTYATGWRIAGMGGAHPLSPALAVLGFASVLLLGHTAQLWTLVVLGSIAVGIVGAYRLARPIGSWRANGAAVITYASVALPYDALARGRLSGLVLYATAPYILLRLLRSTGLPPFGATAAAEPRARREPDRPATDLRRLLPSGVRRSSGGTPRTSSGGEAFVLDFDTFGEDFGDDGEGRASGDTLTEVGQEHALDELGAFDEMVDLDDITRTRAAQRRRRRLSNRSLVPIGVPVRTRPVQVLGLGLLVAITAALAPEALPVTAIVALALGASGLVMGPVRRLGQAATVGLSAVGVALVLLVPWSLDLLLSHRWSGLVGVGPSTRFSPSFADLLRFSTGPTKTAVFGFALVVAALLPLLIGNSWRLAWAARLWAVAVVCFLVAWVFGRGWLHIAPIEPTAMLAPAAAALSLCVGLGAAAFDNDLAGYRFGWRQIAPVVVGAVVALGTIPILASVPNGRWHAPSRDHASVLSWMPDTATQGPFRVLWLGAPEILPATPSRLDDGLAYATSINGPPDALAEWGGPARGADHPLAVAVTTAREGLTTSLGRLLAPLGVRYVVVANRAAPDGTGALARSAPADVAPALAAQVDLRSIESDPSLIVYENAAWAPMRSELPSDAVDASRNRDFLAARSTDISAANSVLAPTRDGSQRYTGQVDAGRVLVANAPTAQWSLRVGGHSASRSRAFGSVMAFDVESPGKAVLHFRTPLAHSFALFLQLLAWLWVVGVVASRGRLSDKVGPAHMRVGGLGVGPTPAHERRTGGEGRFGPVPAEPPAPAPFAPGEAEPDEEIPEPVVLAAVSEPSAVVPEAGSSWLDEPAYPVVSSLDDDFAAFDDELGGYDDGGEIDDLSTYEPVLGEPAPGGDLPIGASVVDEDEWPTPLDGVAGSDAAGGDLPPMVPGGPARRAGAGRPKGKPAKAVKKTRGRAIRLGDEHHDDAS